MQSESITIQQLKLSMEQAFNVSWDVITSKSQMGRLVLLRQLAIYYMIKYLKLSTEITAEIINRDRTTVIYAFDKACTLLEMEDQLYIRYHVQLYDFLQHVHNLDLLTSRLAKLQVWIKNHINHPELSIILNDKHQVNLQISQLENSLKQLIQK